MNTQYSGIGLYAAKNPKVYNNTLVDVAKTGHSGLYFGITFQDWEPEGGRPPSLNPVLRNNIVVQSGNENSTIIEIRYSNELGGLSGLSGMPTMSNNRYYVKNGTAVFEDNRPGYEFSGGLSQWQSHISGDTGTTEGDPEFVASTTGDYHLSSTSPCIDIGTSNGAPVTDFDGVTRPQGYGYDVGAYEYYVGNPIVDIKVNGSDGPLTVSSSTAVSVTVSLDPGINAGQNADWWVCADTPFGLYSYVHPTGWRPGLIRAIATPLFSLSSTEILNSTMPTGYYEITFAVDNNADNILNATWRDSIEVNVE